MADAYNVRTDGKFYYVYRLDGNVAVGQFATGAEAQRSAAVRNQQHNERFGKKKEEQPKATSSQGWVEKQQPQEPKETPDSKPGRPKKSEAPDPPPGQGVSY
jgi:hypothetical protein